MFVVGNLENLIFFLLECLRVLFVFVYVLFGSECLSRVSREAIIVCGKISFLATYVMMNLSKNGLGTSCIL